VDRVERIDSRSEGPGWVLPVAAGARSERRGGRERGPDARRPPSRRFAPGAEPDAPSAEVGADGHVDISA